MSHDEAAEVLGLSTSTVQRWRSAGILPPLRNWPGKRVPLDGAYVRALARRARATDRISVKEAAARLGMKLNKLYHVMDVGLLRAERLGGPRGNYLVEAESVARLKEFIAQQQG